MRLWVRMADVVGTLDPARDEAPARKVEIEVEVEISKMPESQGEIYEAGKKESLPARLGG